MRSEKREARHSWHWALGVSAPREGASDTRRGSGGTRASSLRPLIRDMILLPSAEKELQKLWSENREAMQEASADFQ